MTISWNLFLKDKNGKFYRVYFSKLGHKGVTNIHDPSKDSAYYYDRKTAKKIKTTMENLIKSEYHSLNDQMEFI